jgi:dihydropteroate synthase
LVVVLNNLVIKNTDTIAMFTLNCKGKLLVAEKPLVMGIINATPDSFYEGHIGKGIDGIVALAEKMVADGADLLDIGGQSTRPGSRLLTADEEMERVLPVIEAIAKALPQTILSVDTFSSIVVQQAVQAGASIVNDISGGSMDPQMLPTVAALQVPYVCMHMQGTPQTMQQNPVYGDVTKDVLDYFISKLAECRNAGIKDVIIDPGFGFGKTTAHNFELLRNLAALQLLKCPLLAGLSRKSMIYKTLHTTAAGALNGTTALNMLALHNGASLLRVHDVQEAIEAVTLFSAYAAQAGA